MSYHQTTHFREADLYYWRKSYRSCWSLSYWKTAVRDVQHYDIWQTIDSRYRNNQCPHCQSSRDYKMLYDSYLWRTILREHGYHSHTHHVIELLPGGSATIPVALCSLGFRGRLDRVDMDNEVVLPYESLGYTVNWIRKNISSGISSDIPFDLVVGNHIVDDLIFGLLVGARNREGYSTLRDPDYRDPDMCAGRMAEMYRRWRNATHYRGSSRYIRHNTGLPAHGSGTYIARISIILRSGQCRFGIHKRSSRRFLCAISKTS